MGHPYTRRSAFPPCKDERLATFIWRHVTQGFVIATVVVVVHKVCDDLLQITGCRMRPLVQLLTDSEGLVLPVAPPPGHSEVRENIRLS